MSIKTTQDPQISLFYKSYAIKASSLFILISLIIGVPAQANAGFMDTIKEAVFGSNTKTADAVSNDEFGSDDFSNNLQKMELVASLSTDPDAKNVNDCSNMMMDEGALMTDVCDIGSGFENDNREEVTSYTVEEGDTLSGIASQFDISMNTIKWENNLTSNTLKVGQKLNILPMTGVRHIVKKGDTLEKIAAKYDADVEDIKVFNGFTGNSSLRQGDKAYVPNGIIKLAVVVEKPSSIKKPIVDNPGTPIVSGYYMNPASGRITSPYGPRKRAFHYGIDIGNVRGTPVVAAASGVVIEVLGSCKEGKRSCGGRYGNYIVIAHSNSTTTRYAHLQKVSVSVGENVTQGENIGTIGNTGRSSGPHLHTEIQKANGSYVKPVFFR